MDRKRLGSRHMLVFVLGAMLGSSCLEVTPLEECFDAADEEPNDRFEVISVGVKDDEECPKEGARAVKDAAQKHADFCAGDAKLRHIACGPLEDPDAVVGRCKYVAVYDKGIGPCAYN